MAETHPGYIVFGTGDPSYVVTKSILISTTNAEGASLVGVEDSGTNYTGTDLETVLVEIADGTTLDARYVNVTGDTMTGALVITPTADSTAIFQVNQADTTNVLTVDTTNARVGIGTDSPDSAFHIKANFPGQVGNNYAGQIIIQNPTDSVFSNAVITGYESDGDGNPDQQLWYLGSSSINNSDIIFLNRRNSKLALGTNGTSRITILGNGNVGIGVTDPDTKLEVLHAGNQLKLSYDGTDNAIFAVDTAGDLTVTPSGTQLLSSVPFRGVTSLWWRVQHIDLASVPALGAVGAIYTPQSANNLNGYQLDNAPSEEYLYFNTHVGTDWDEASDLELVVQFQTNVDNSGGSGTDTVDFDLLMYYKGDGETAQKTQDLDASVVVGTAAQYYHEEVMFTIDWDLVDHVVQIGDCVSFRLHLNTTDSEVDNVIVHHAMFRYKTKKVRAEV